MKNQKLLDDETRFRPALSILLPTIYFTTLCEAKVSSSLNHVLFADY